MILHPTVVIGVGSTGKHIVAGIEKYLYEVLNGEALDLFRFLVFETAINQAEQNMVRSEWRTQPVDIKVHDIGSAFYTMKQTVGEDFNWCPPGYAHRWSWRWKQARGRPIHAVAQSHKGEQDRF